MPLFGASYAAPNKDTTILYWFRSPKTVLKTPVNGKIQGLFKAFECFSSTFQGKFNFQGLFKTVLNIQVLFKPVRTLIEENDREWLLWIGSSGQSTPKTGTPWDFFCYCLPIQLIQFAQLADKRKKISFFVVMLIVILLLSHLISCDMCGTWLYRFLILAVFLTLKNFGYESS